MISLERGQYIVITSKLKRESKYLCYKAIFNDNMDESLYQKILLQRPPWEVTENFDEGQVIFSFGAIQKDVFTLRAYNGIISNHLPGSSLLADVRTLMRRMAREHGDEALRHFRFCYDLSKNMATFRAHVGWLER